MEGNDHATVAVRYAAELIANAEALLITAGAGMSVDSGLPDFRGPEGFWRAYPPLRKLGVAFEQMAQPHWFESRPRMAWVWYGHRQQLYKSTSPHDGYTRLAHLARTMPAGWFVLTSNVDGQFFAAGYDSDRIVEQHGSVHRYQCTTPCADETWDAETPAFTIHLDTLEAHGDLPTCRSCGTLARPNVLMFDDASWIDAVTRGQERRFRNWLDGLHGKRLVILELGAGTAVATIRWAGERLAARHGAPLVRVNPDGHGAANGVVAVPLGAREAIARIDAAVAELRANG